VGEELAHGADAGVEARLLDERLLLLELGAQLRGDEVAQVRAVLEGVDDGDGGVGDARRELNHALGEVLHVRHERIELGALLHSSSAPSSTSSSMSSTSA